MTFRRRDLCKDKVKHNSKLMKHNSKLKVKLYGNLLNYSHRVHLMVTLWTIQHP